MKNATETEHGISHHGRWCAAVVILALTLAGCAAGGSAKSDQAFIGGAVNLQLDVSFAGGGQPPGKAPGNLIAALKSPGKEGRWQPAIFLYSQQSVTIEAKISGQQKKVTVNFPESCCDVTSTAGDGVTITAPVWSSDQIGHKRAYYFDLKVDGMLIDPVIIPR